MAKSDDILNELSQLGSELPAGNNNPLTVPPGYFEGLASSVLAKIKSEESDPISYEIKEIAPVLANLIKKMPYSVPENYFESNIASLPAFYSEIESPLLSSIGKQMPYETPVGYFENLSESVNAIVGKKEEAKVVPMFSRKWMKVAVAAVISGLLVLGGVKYFDNAPVEPANYVVKYDTVSKQRESVAKNSSSLAKELKTVSTQELQAFIKNVDVPTATPATTASIKTPNKNKVKEILKDVPDDELESFLNQIPTGEDELFIID